MSKLEDTGLIKENEYNALFNQAAEIINQARFTVAKQLNKSASSMYFEIGRLLAERKIESTHGSGVVKRLSIDLKAQYPQMGVSPRNLWDMKKFYERFCDCDIKLRQAVAVLPWGHILRLMKGTNDDNAIMFYAQEVINKGWNRDLLLNAIKLGMYEKQKELPAYNNFEKVLPAAQAEYANSVFSSTYNLGFLGVTNPVLELELEKRLTEKIKRFLLELGKGFTYIGNQHILEFNGKEHKVDMLFFHRSLRSLVAIDLKIGEFKPEYAGKMNYYLSLLDRLERGETENRSIGIILCAEKNHVEVELALEDMGKPIGVADYQLLLPKEELQKVLQDEIKLFDDENHFND